MERRTEHLEKKKNRSALQRTRRIEPLRVKQRDSQSIELKFRYLLNREKGQSKETYDVNIFFFLPYSFYIGPGTYDRSSFYEDMKLYLRFNTPMLTAAELLDVESPVSPLARVERMLDEARENGSFKDPEAFIYEGKLLACIFKSLLRDGLSELRTGADSADLPPKSGKKLAATFKEVREVARRFHRITAGVTAELSDPPEEIVQHTKMIDEHLSLLVEKYLTPLLVVFDRPESRSDYERIAVIVEKEIKYRNKAGYPTVTRENTDKSALEEHIYREKMLKRYATEVLFFDVRRKNTAKGMEQLLYAVAAGIAMIFATAAAFFGQSVYGRLSSSLFVILVISYMAKDRIKDLFRDILRKSLGAYFFDRTSILSDPRFKKKLAVIKERTFFAREKKTDPEVLAVRAKGSFERILSRTANETILTYNKRISLNSRVLRGIHNRIVGLADINIIDLGRFLRHLASQQGVVPALSGKGNIALQQVKRIYHLTMIVQIKNYRGTSISRYRLIADAGGIKRIEPVVVQDA